mmetsp:Transcript_34736/g.43830  ORF Transcript_34736/g.43830 Transcript_34736/m.43830 type:complete len:594 (-) Transcript_34736:426-2207(-)
MGYQTFESTGIAPTVFSNKESSQALSKQNQRRHLVTVLAVLVVVAILALAGGSLRNGRSTLMMFAAEESDLSGLTFVTYNEYTETNPIDSVWDFVAEPYRETTFEAKFSTPFDTDGITFFWEIDGELLESNERVVTYTFRKTGPVELKLTAAEGISRSDYSAIVVVKYVRREIRSLTNSDREKLLDAMEIIYRIGEEEGHSLYGPDFRNIDSFSKEHLNGAGRKECDHWHDDAGIMTHHVGFTLEFEQSLQLIDPSLCLPYWEYTLDELLYDELEDSPIFDDDWFSPLNPDNDDHVVDSGRWAYTPVNTATDFDVINPWGLLRTPWNTDPSPYLTRNKYVNGGKLFDTPDCTSFKTAFSQTSLARINNMLNGATHGPVHIEIGGEWNVGDEMVEFAEKYGFAYNMVLVFKILWRMGYATCPETCSPGDDCVCTANKEMYESKGMTARDVLTVADVLKYYEGDEIYYDDNAEVYHLTGYEDNPELEMKVFEMILDGLSNPGFVGEMYTSSAPTDPTFWLIHPTAERLLNWRRLVKQYKPLDETWDYWHQGGANPSDDGWVCDWSEIEKFGLPNCWKQVCEGHGKDDELEFSFFE